MGAQMLHVHLQMILQVFANAGQMMNRCDANFAQIIFVAYARHLQQLRRIKGTTAQDHFFGSNYFLSSKRKCVLHTHNRLAFGNQSRRKRPALHRQVLAMLHGMQICASCTKSTTSLDVSVERRKTFLLETIYIRRKRMASFLHCLEKCTEQRVLDCTTLHM